MVPQRERSASPISNQPARHADSLPAVIVGYLSYTATSMETLRCDSPLEGRRHPPRPTPAYSGRSNDNLLYPSNHIRNMGVFAANRKYIVFYLINYEHDRSFAKARRDRWPQPLTPQPQSLNLPVSLGTAVPLQTARHGCQVELERRAAPPWVSRRCQRCISGCKAV